MQKPVTQEELDFVACESDRFESEKIKWKNELIQVCEVLSIKFSILLILKTLLLYSNL
jgi:hypothetical protein